MVDDRTVRAHRANQRKKFESWMRRYWGGINLVATPLMRSSFEYKETAAQTAWECWMKFNKVQAE